MLASKGYVSGVRQRVARRHHERHTGACTGEKPGYTRWVPQRWQSREAAGVFKRRITSTARSSLSCSATSGAFIRALPPLALRRQQGCQRGASRAHRGVMGKGGGDRHLLQRLPLAPLLLQILPGLGLRLLHLRFQLRTEQSTNRPLCCTCSHKAMCCTLFLLHLPEKFR